MPTSLDSHQLKYIPRCNVGWSGKSCDVCCKLSGCLHGDCGKYSDTCLCHEGWRGILCDKPICRYSSFSLRHWHNNFIELHKVKHQLSSIRQQKEMLICFDLSTDVLVTLQQIFLQTFIKYQLLPKLLMCSY